MTNNAERLETDKLTEEFTLRIPAITKIGIDKLPKHFKRRLNERTLITIAQSLHEAAFDPRRYLVEEYFESKQDAR
jgi:hypothetical protein